MNAPPDEFGSTVAFYREVMGLPVRRTTEESSIVFESGRKNLWIDRVPALSQAEI
jgi:hypothetical protein